MLCKPQKRPKSFLTLTALSVETGETRRLFLLLVYFVAVVFAAVWCNTDKLRQPEARRLFAVLAMNDHMCFHVFRLGKGSVLRLSAVL